jgi:hypothetical protein
MNNISEVYTAIKHSGCVRSPNVPPRDRQTLEGSLNLASLPSTKPAWLGCVHQNNQTELHYVHTRMCRPVNKVLCRNLWHRFVLLPCQPMEELAQFAATAVGCSGSSYRPPAPNARQVQWRHLTRHRPLSPNFVWQTPCSAAMNTVRRCADGVSVTAVATYSYNHPESTLVRAPIT